MQLSWWAYGWLDCCCRSRHPSWYLSHWNPSSLVQRWGKFCRRLPFDKGLLWSKLCTEHLRTLPSSLLDLTLWLKVWKIEENWWKLRSDILSINFMWESSRTKVKLLSRFGKNWTFQTTGLSLTSKSFSRNHKSIILLNNKFFKTFIFYREQNSQTWLLRSTIIAFLCKVSGKLRISEITTKTI